MSAKWKTTLPRTTPDDGMCYVVFSVKDSSGSRAEFVGEVLADRMRAALAELLKEQNK